MHVPNFSGFNTSKAKLEDEEIEQEEDGEGVYGVGAVLAALMAGTDRIKIIVRTCCTWRVLRGSVSPKPLPLYKFYFLFFLTIIFLDFLFFLKKNNYLKIYTFKNNFTKFVFIKMTL